jgi:hemolysin activation/secretion protein
MYGAKLGIARLGAAAMGVVALSAGHVAAQGADNSSTSPGSPRSQPDLNRQIPPASGPSSTLSAPRAAGSCPFGGQGLSVTLTRVIVDGATVITADEIHGAVADLLGAPHDLNVVCQARDRVAALFARKGYRLTRVDVPPQRIEDGVLRLQATEGSVSRLDTDGLASLGPSAALAQAYFEPLLKKKPTSWNDIERAVLLARDIPGSEIGVRIHGGAPGTVELVADARPRRKFDLSVGVQHMGTEELGPWAVYGRLDANSFTRFGDRTSLVLFSTTTGDQKVVEGVESFNIGSSGLRAQAEVDYARTTPEGALAPLKIDGDFVDTSFKLDYPLIRTQALSLFIGGRFDYINQNNDLGILRGIVPGEPVLFKDKLRLLTADADLRWRPESAPQLDFEISGSVVKGISGLGASHPGELTLSRIQGDPQATVLRTDASLRWTFNGRQGFLRKGGPWVEGRLSGQWADHPLTAFEEFQIGNYTIGRGYTPGAASGDRAIGGVFEAGWRFTYRAGPKGQPGWLEPYAFVDAAHVQNLDIGGYSSTIASVGGGVRALLPWQLQLDVAYASPLERPFPGAPNPDGRVLLSLSRVFSFR